MMAVSVATGRTELRASAPRMLFEGDYYRARAHRAKWAGRRPQTMTSRPTVSAS